MPGWPVIPNCARSTASGIARTSAPVASYTVIVCRYIMFCANTSPVPVAVTDFGEIAPVIVATRVRRKSSAGLWARVVVVVVAGAVDAVATLAWVVVVEPSGEVCSRCTTGCVPCESFDVSRFAIASAPANPSATTRAIPAPTRFRFTAKSIAARSRIDGSASRCQASSTGRATARELSMDVRSIVDVEPEVEHNGTVPVWYLVHPREMKALTEGGHLELVNEFEVANGGVLFPHSPPTREFYFAMSR